MSGTTVLKRLADLPTPETPREERQRRIAEKLARRGAAGIVTRRDAARRMSKDEGQVHKLRELDRRRGERGARVTVTWLPEPMPLAPGTRIMVVGVCSDAAGEVKERWL